MQVTDVPTVLLSVETSAREFDSKLVLAAALAGRGCRVVVGHKEAVREMARHSRRILWIGKGLFSPDSDAHLADSLTSNSSSAMFLSDEGAMHQTGGWIEQILQKHWVDHLRVRQVGRLCVWGSRQRDVIAKHAPELNDSIVITGSPRFDVCLPAYDWMSDALPARHVVDDRPMILACTRFSAVAHARGLSAPFKLKLRPGAWPATMDPSRIHGLWFEKWRQDVHDFAEFVSLTREVACTRRDLRVVIRPHPSESVEFYTEVFKAIDNVNVIREGSALDWIRRAAVVIHSNSTTGVEAVLAGRPTLNFLPTRVDRAEQDVEVAREAGMTSSSISEALNSLEYLLAGGRSLQVWSSSARSMLNNLLEQSLPLVVKEALAAIHQHGLESSRLVVPKQQNVSQRLLRHISPGRQYLASKRGFLDPARAEVIAAECRARGIGGGLVQVATPDHVVLAPA